MMFIFVSLSNITSAANGSQGFHRHALKLVKVRSSPNVLKPGALAIHCAAWLCAQYFSIVIGPLPKSMTSE